MLRLLQSIFGNHQPGSYPESLVKMAIERTVDGTDPWLRSVSGYRKKLRPAVIHAIDHVIGLVESLPPPVPVYLGQSGVDVLLKSYFISTREMESFFSTDPALTAFRSGSGADSPVLIALLTMEMQEKVIFGAELSGDIVLRDIPKITVSFDAHRLIDPTGDEVQTRRNLKRRAFDHLLSLALKRLSFVKSEREELVNRRKLLQAKHNLLQREGWGFDSAGSTDKPDEDPVEERLAQLEAQLHEFGGDDREMETYLELVADVLSKAEEYLQSRTETIYVDRMAIKHNEPSSETSALTFNELRNAEGRRLVVMLISLRSEDLPLV